MVSNGTKATDSTSEGQQATARHFTDAEVERNVSEIVNKVKATDSEMTAMRAARRDGGSAKTDAVDAANAGLNNDVADWRKTECVIDEKTEEGLGPRYRILHRPSGRSADTYGHKQHEFCGFVMPEDAKHGFIFRTLAEAQAVLASIPDSARPSVADSAAAPVVRLGQGDYETKIMPSDLGVSNVRPVSDPEQKQIDETLDAFGITKPPEGKGAPAAPSPVFQTWDGKTVHYGSVICPITAPDSQWIAGAEDADFNTGCIWLQHLHTDARMLLSREACGKCWELAVHRASATAPTKDPADLAQVIFNALDERTISREKVRGLVCQLLLLAR